MSVINQDLAEHYTWGDNCDGWHLVKTHLVKINSLSVIQERVPSGSKESRHFHEKSEQFFFVLSGTATMELEGEVFLVDANNGIHVPAGSKHQLSNAHKTDLLFTVTSTPPSHGDRVDVA